MEEDDETASLQDWMSDRDPPDFWDLSHSFLKLLIALLWVGWVIGSMWLYGKVNLFAIPLSLVALAICWLCTQAALPVRSTGSADDRGEPRRKRSTARIVLLVLTASLAVPAIIVVLVGFLYNTLIRNCHGGRI